MRCPNLQLNQLDRLLVVGCSVGHKSLLHVSRQYMSQTGFWIYIYKINVERADMKGEKLLFLTDKYVCVLFTEYTLILNSIRQWLM